MNKELPVNYAVDGGINCPKCGNNNLVMINIKSFEYCDEENGLCVADYYCKDCNSKFRCNIRLKYQIKSANDFRLLD